MILKEENTKTYQKGYDKCKEDVLELISGLKEYKCPTCMDDKLEELKSKLIGEEERE